MTGAGAADAAVGGLAGSGAADATAGRAAAPEDGTPDAAGIPGTIAAAWGVRERPHKGPRPVLSLPRIVDAAWGDAPGPAAPGEGWRAGLSGWAWAMRASARRHPWAVRIPLNGLPIMPHEVAWFERALACLQPTGLTEAQKASVIMLLSGYVRNLAATEADIEAAIRASGRSPSEWMAAYSRILGGLTDQQRFPALGAFLAAGVFDAADDPDDEFAFGLDRILDGIEVLTGG